MPITERTSMAIAAFQNAAAPFHMPLLLRRKENDVLPLDAGRFRRFLAV
jgi:hypothetical protein